MKGSEGQLSQVEEMIERYGRCVELVSMDPHFHDITIGLYEKDGLLTVWTYSKRVGVEDRIERIRDQLCNLGGLVAVAGSRNQVRFPCGELHSRPLKFLMPQAVEKDPNFSHPTGEMVLRDTRSPLTLKLTPHHSENRWVYQVSAQGEARNAPFRLRAITMGFRKYGEMEQAGNLGVSFNCGHRHEPLVRLLFPFSRNISAVENMLESSAQRGQLTTGTAGFSPL